MALLGASSEMENPFLGSLPRTHKLSLSQFPSEEDSLKLPQTMHQRGHSRGALGAIP
jgi:hypothetical protein